MGSLFVVYLLQGYYTYKLHTLEYDYTIYEDVHNCFEIDLAFKMAEWWPYLKIWFSANISSSND